jgi:hypothetical protein
MSTSRDSKGNGRPRSTTDADVGNIFLFIPNLIGMLLLSRDRYEE